MLHILHGGAQIIIPNHICMSLITTGLYVPSRQRNKRHSVQYFGGLSFYACFRALQGALIRRLDEYVLSLGDTAEALDALVSVAFRLRNAGVRYVRHLHPVPISKNVIPHCVPGGGGG